MANDEMVEVAAKISKCFDNFKTVVGEAPNYLLISEIFYGYITYLVNSTMQRPLDTPVSTYRGCTISIVGKAPTPYFEFVRFDQIHQ